MRRMIVRTASVETCSDPSAAIRAAVQADCRLRTVADEEVRGRTIRQVIWDDATLSLGLDDGRYLNCVARKGLVRCSLDPTPAVSQPAAEDQVLLELDGHPIPWHRAEVGRKYTGTLLERLWFGNGVVYIYVRKAILACHLVESHPQGRPWLFWTESE